MNETDVKIEAPGPWSRRRLVLFLPLAFFLALALLFFSQLGVRDPSKLPSVLINKSVPNFALPQLEHLPGDGLSDEKLAEGVHILNVWASWCASCRYEHPFLARLALKTGAKLYGLNYKDTAKNGRRFLARYGNPYTAVGMDKNGRAGIEWGVYGVPETYIIDRQGRIRFKQIGPLFPDLVADKIVPVIRKLRAE